MLNDNIFIYKVRYSYTTGRFGINQTLGDVSKTKYYTLDKFTVSNGASFIDFQKNGYFLVNYEMTKLDYNQGKSKLSGRLVNEINKSMLKEKLTEFCED